MVNENNSGASTPSNQYKLRKITEEDKMVEGFYGEPTNVAFLPVAEMPSEKVYGKMDPMEGCPAREMTKKLEAGDLPLGEFALSKDKADS